MEKKSVVLYKNQVAVIEDRDGDKYLVRYQVSAATPTGKKAVYGEQKVREKDIILLHAFVNKAAEAFQASNKTIYRYLQEMAEREAGIQVKVII